MGFLTHAGHPFGARAPARIQQVTNPPTGTGDSWLGLSWSSSDHWTVRKRLKGAEPKAGTGVRSSHN